MTENQKTKMALLFMSKGNLTNAELENMLEDVVNVLDLSDWMIEKHGPMGTPPADLVKEVLDRKNLEISALRRGFNVLNINEMTEEEIIKASIVYMNNEIDATFDDNKNHEDDKVCSFREIEIAFKEGAKWALVNQWNAETKHVEDIEHKSFKPKDWCLMRTASDYAWCLCQFSNMDSESYVAIGGAMHEYCIPYNDETKHILGTTEDAPEKYKTW